MPGALVLKFGGAALADGPATRRAARIVADQLHARPGARMVVIVSAHRGVTDMLDRAAKLAATGTIRSDPVRIRHRSLLAQLGLPSELLDRYWRELTLLLEAIVQKHALEGPQHDLALSFGERLSARVVARVLEEEGLPSTPVDAWDLGLLSDSCHGSARPLQGTGDAIRAGLEQLEGIPVVTGFLAKDRFGNLTTLGRDGSDVTASVIAQAVQASEIQFWKCVPGIMSADPELVPEARRLDSITYLEVAELAFHGANVLHPSSVIPAVRGQARVTLRDATDPQGPGTTLTTEAAHSGAVGVASRRDQLHLDLRLRSSEQRAECAARFFSTLAKHSVPHTLSDISGDRLSAWVEHAPGIPAALRELGPAASVQRDLATVALVGSGVGRSASLARAAQESLVGAGVEVRRAFPKSRGSSQAFSVDRKDLAGAAAALHGLVLAQPLRSR